MIFQNRREAGKKLAEELGVLKDQKDVIVAGLARGGVVIAAEIASHFGWPLDLIIVRKIGAPDNEELALGAVAEEGKGIFNDELITLLGVSKEYLRKEAERQKEEIKAWKARFLKEHVFLSFEGKVVILVDDGIATGASMKVAIESARAKGAAKVILAVPVAAQDAFEQLSKLADE